jgi:hypothetical protein
MIDHLKGDIQYLPYLRIIWNKSSEEMMYKRLIFKNPYKYFVSVENCSFRSFRSCLDKNVRIGEKLQRAETDFRGKVSNR